MMVAIGERCCLHRYGELRRATDLPLLYATSQNEETREDAGDGDAAAVTREIRRIRL